MAAISRGEGIAQPVLRRFATVERGLTLTDLGPSYLRRYSLRQCPEEQELWAQLH